MHVDHTQRLWPFFDLYGSTIKVKALGVTGEVSDNSRNSANLHNNSGRNGLEQSSNSISLPLTVNQSNVSTLLSTNDLKFKAASSISSSNSNGSLNGSGNECTVCYEQQINSVLYMCGHICMCYDCAVKQWRGNGQCPICRANIKDVIRTFWS